MTLATSTIERTFGRAATTFATIATAYTGDATAVFNTIYGLSDGKDYGRYAFGQNPMLGYADNASSLQAMIAEGVAKRQGVGDAAIALVTAGNTAIAGFGPAADAMTEAVRQACANPRDAVRILARLAGFAMLRPGGLIAEEWAVVDSGSEDPLTDWETGIPPISDALGAEFYVLTARAVLRLRLASAASLVRATVDVAPNSQQDAQVLRDRVCLLLRALADKCRDIWDDRSTRALDAAAAAVYDDLTLRGAALAPVAVKSFNTALPAEFVAELLYDDPTRAADLVARNDPPHPLFLQRTFEALAN